MSELLNQIDACLAELHIWYMVEGKADALDSSTFDESVEKLLDLTYQLITELLRERNKDAYLVAAKIRDALKSRGQFGYKDRVSRAVDWMGDLCTLLESQRPAVSLQSESDDESMDSIVGRKFWQAYRQSGSQNERADVIANSVTDDDWKAFARIRNIGKQKRDYFYKLITECDGNRTPKWLEDLK